MTDPEPLRFYRSFTVRPDFPSKLTITSYRYLLLRSAGLVRVFVIAIALAAAAFIATVPQSGPIYALQLALLGLAGFLVIIALAAGIGFLIERRRLRAKVPGGTEFAVGFRSDTILMRSPMDTAEVAYDRYLNWERFGDFIVLRQRQSRILNFLPAECFTDESFEWMGSKIAEQKRKP
ncbi:MAG TPA: hypothetical protein VGF80_10270 [Galbitalea sp.]